MLVFLAFTCVVMLNIFIAQLSNRYSVIQQNGGREFDIKKAKTIAKLELKDDFTCFYFGQVSRKSLYHYVLLCVSVQANIRKQQPLPFIMCYAISTMWRKCQLNMGHIRRV